MVDRRFWRRAVPLIFADLSAAMRAKLSKFGIFLAAIRALASKRRGRLLPCFLFGLTVRPLAFSAVVGRKMAMAFLSPTFPMMRRAAVGAGDDIVSFGKIFSTNGAGLPFIKEHKRSHFPVGIDNAIVMHSRRNCNESGEMFKKCSDYATDSPSAFTDNKTSELSSFRSTV